MSTLNMSVSSVSQELFGFLLPLIKDRVVDEHHSDPWRGPADLSVR